MPKINIEFYYMAMSQEDWKQTKSRIWLAKIDLDRGLDQPRSQVISPSRRETLVGSGHVSPRIWEITNKRLGGGADKCEICLYKA